LTNFATLTRMRIRLTLRNKMFLFFSVIMPFGFFFLYAGIFAKGVPRGVRYLLGPVIALTVMGSFWGLSAALVMFREQGILRRFHVTPVTPSDMLASSIVANFVLTMPTVIVEILFARFIFHVTSFGNLFSVFLLIALGTMSFASMGLFLPATYLVTELQDAIYWSAAPWSRDFLIAAASLVVWAALTFFLSAQLFRWEPESKIPGRAKLLVAATAIPFLLLGIWENSSSHTISKAKAMAESLDAPSKPDAPSGNAH